MNYSTNHTIYLQDGSLFNFRKRFKKQAKRLVEVFSEVSDGRSRFGKRHPLSLILTILFTGVTAGNTTIKDCHLWAVHNRKWLLKYFYLLHGIPDARTLSRAIQRADVDSLVTAFLFWRQLVYGVDPSLVASFDGKTMNGIHGGDGKERIKHILSLFSHTTHQILGQVGVTQKENEIPAFRRLLSTQKPFVSGMLLLGDALHTQKETITLILSSRADYLLYAKGNQSQLELNLKDFFDNLPFQTMTDEVEVKDYSKGRDMTATITISFDLLMINYLTQEHGWEGVRTIGKIQRFGTRAEIDHRTRVKVIKQVQETVYFICSKQLSAKETAQITRNHWCIENNLHWEKDYLFLEDRQTLRSGNAPQVMTFLRSMCLSLFNLFQFTSPAQAISNFKMSKSHHHNFLNMAGVI